MESLDPRLQLAPTPRRNGRPTRITRTQPHANRHLADSVGMKGGEFYPPRLTMPLVDPQPGMWIYRSCSGMAEPG